MCAGLNMFICANTTISPRRESPEHMIESGVKISVLGLVSIHLSIDLCEGREIMVPLLIISTIVFSMSGG